MARFTNLYYNFKDFLIFSPLRSTVSLISLLFQNFYFLIRKKLSIKSYLLNLNNFIYKGGHDRKTDINIWYMNITSHLVKPSLFAVGGVFIMKLCELIGADVKYIHCQSGFDYCHSGANPKNYKSKMPCYGCVKFNSSLYVGSKKLVFKQSEIKKEINETLSIENLINFKYKDLSVGKICIPSIRSILRTSDLSSIKNASKHLKRAIESSITFIDWLDYEYSIKKPEKIVVFNGLNFNEAILREWGLNKDIPVITFENGKRESTIELSNEVAVISGFVVGMDP